MWTHDGIEWWKRQAVRACAIALSFAKGVQQCRPFNQKLEDLRGSNAIPSVNKSGAVDERTVGRSGGWQRMLDQIVDTAVAGSAWVNGVEVDAEIERLVPQLIVGKLIVHRPR